GTSATGRARRAGQVLTRWRMKKGRGFPRPSSSVRWLRSLAVAHELQQEHEQVEEVEVELQRAHDGGLAKKIPVAVRQPQVGVLDVLRIVRRQTGEDQNTDSRDGKVHRRRLEED